MTPIRRHRLLWLNLSALAASVLMAFGWWAGVGRVSAVSPSQARTMLDDLGTNAILVDVRPAAEFASRHLPGAMNWPWVEVRTAGAMEAIPAELRDKRLLVLCDTGIHSALAVQRMKSWGLRNVWSVRGGMVDWSLFEAAAAGTESRTGSDPAATSPVPKAHAMPLWKQWVVILTAFGVKPLYLLLSLIVMVVIWRRSEADLSALRWGLVWFWGGEQACTANYLLYGGRSELLEYLHDYGMAAGFAFVTWAMMEAMDGRLLRFTAAKERCAALALCGRCVKYADGPCGLRRLFLLFIPAAGLLAILPLTADYKLGAYHSEVLGATVCYSHTITSQLFEMRLCPVVSLVFFAVSWWVLYRGGEKSVSLSKTLFAAGLGPLSFGLLRTFLVATFNDDLMWFETWEEWTELLFVAGTAFVLWVFWPGLASRQQVASSAPVTA